MVKSNLLDNLKNYSNSINHPFVSWSRLSQKNFFWIRQLGLNLCKEFSYRHSLHHSHRFEDDIKKAFTCKDKNPLTLNKAPRCMPEYFKNEDIVKSYRDYYLSYKSDLLQYTKRNVPYWVSDLGLGEHR